MRTYRIYGSGVATASAVASLKIAKGGKIKSVGWSVYGQGPADLTYRGAHELSIVSTNNFQVNDAAGPISTCPSANNGVSAGFTSNKLDFPEYEVQDGQTLYLHQFVSGTAPASAIAYVEIRIS